MPRLEDIAEKLHKSPDHLGLMVQKEELKIDKQRKKNTAKLKRNVSFARDFKDWVCSTVQGFGLGEPFNAKTWKDVLRDGHIPVRYASDREIMADFAC